MCFLPSSLRVDHDLGIVGCSPVFSRDGTDVEDICAFLLRRKGVAPVSPGAYNTVIGIKARPGCAQIQRELDRTDGQIAAKGKAFKGIRLIRLNDLTLLRKEDRLRGNRMAALTAVADLFNGKNIFRRLWR